MGVADTITVYEYIEATHPFVLAYLIWARLLTWCPHLPPERAEPETIVIDGRPYRDVTDLATASDVGAGNAPGHDAFRRVHGALRQVRWG